MKTDSFRSSQQYIAPDEAVDVDRSNAERWLIEHPGDVLVLMFWLAVLLNVPIVGWLLRRLFGWGKGK